MKNFIAKHQDKIKGSLSCFDRVIFKGHLPISSAGGMETFLKREGILIKDFKHFVVKQAEAVIQNAKLTAEKADCPYLFLQNRVRKEEYARKIAQERQITQGLVCVLSAIEPCSSFKIVYGNKRPRLQKTLRKCLMLYFYFVDRAFGLMHVRIQTWFPFTIQLYINGHEWLARKMDRHGLGYQKVDNAFVDLEDYKRAQRFADGFVSINWPRVLETFARKVNPLLCNTLSQMKYYWVVDQAELSTDLIFRDREVLRSLYRKLLEHAMLNFSAEDVLSFLGKKLHHRFEGEAVSDYKKRWPGARIKHRIKDNWIKMYDKHGIVLRIETVINKPREFKVRRKGWIKNELITGWFPMSKNVCNLYRYAEVSLAANGRYLDALSAVDGPTLSDKCVHSFAEPKHIEKRSYRGFNPFSKSDQALFAAVLRGEHCVSGFRNRDIRRLLYRPSADRLDELRKSASVSRLLNRLHVHGLIAKIPRSRRWRVTQRGYSLMSYSLDFHSRGNTNISLNAA